MNLMRYMYSLDALSNILINAAKSCEPCLDLNIMIQKNILQYTKYDMECVPFNEFLLKIYTSVGQICKSNKLLSIKLSKLCESSLIYMAAKRYDESLSYFLNFYQDTDILLNIIYFRTIHYFIEDINGVKIHQSIKIFLSSELKKVAKDLLYILLNCLTQNIAQCEGDSTMHDDLFQQQAVEIVILIIHVLTSLNGYLSIELFFSVCVPPNNVPFIFFLIQLTRHPVEEIRLDIYNYIQSFLQCHASNTKNRFDLKPLIEWSMIDLIANDCVLVRCSKNCKESNSIGLLYLEIVQKIYILNCFSDQRHIILHNVLMLTCRVILNIDKECSSYYLEAIEKLVRESIKSSEFSLDSDTFSYLLQICYNYLCSIYQTYQIQSVQSVSSSTVNDLEDSVSVIVPRLIRRIFESLMVISAENCFQFCVLILGNLVRQPLLEIYSWKVCHLFHTWILINNFKTKQNFEEIFKIINAIFSTKNYEDCLNAMLNIPNQCIANISHEYLSIIRIYIQWYNDTVISKHLLSIVTKLFGMLEYIEQTSTNILLNQVVLSENERQLCETMEKDISSILLICFHSWPKCFINVYDEIATRLLRFCSGTGGILAFSAEPFLDALLILNSHMDEKRQYNLHILIFEEINNILSSHEFSLIFDNESNFIKFIGLDQDDIEFNLKNNKKMEIFLQIVGSLLRKSKFSIKESIPELLMILRHLTSKICNLYLFYCNLWDVNQSHISNNIKAELSIDISIVTENICGIEIRRDRLFYLQLFGDKLFHLFISLIMCNNDVLTNDSLMSIFTNDLIVQTLKLPLNRIVNWLKIVGRPLLLKTAQNPNTLKFSQWFFSVILQNFKNFYMDKTISINLNTSLSKNIIHQLEVGHDALKNLFLRDLVSLTNACILIQLNKKEYFQPKSPFTEYEDILTLFGKYLFQNNIEIFLNFIYSDTILNDHTLVARFQTLYEAIANYGLFINFTDFLAHDDTTTKNIMHFIFSRLLLAIVYHINDPCTNNLLTNHLFLLYKNYFIYKDGFRDLISNSLSITEIELLNTTEMAFNCIPMVELSPTTVDVNNHTKKLKKCFKTFILSIANKSNKDHMETSDAPFLCPQLKYANALKQHKSSSISTPNTDIVDISDIFK